MLISHKALSYQEMRPHTVPIILATVCCFLCFLVVLHAACVIHILPGWSSWVAPLFMAIATLCCFIIMPRNFTLGFLFALLPFLIAWHLGATYHSFPIMAICTLTFLVFLLQFLDCAAGSMMRKGATWNHLVRWQMTFIRIYIGYDMVGHFTEKLFAGQGSFSRMTEIFANSYVVSLPPVFVLTAGIVEFAVAIGVGMGILTRLAAFGAAFYYFIASVIGSHFVNGFGWLASGGGWEYCMLMIALFLSFVPTGAGKFSVDGWLLRNGFMPKCLRCLAIPKIAMQYT